MVDGKMRRGSERGWGSGGEKITKKERCEERGRVRKSKKEGMGR